MTRSQTFESETPQGHSDFLLPPAVSVSTIKEREAVRNLYAHQISAVEKSVKNNFNIAIYHSCGTGKTLTALEIFKKMRDKENIKLLVVCPLSLINTSWADDIKKFTNFTFSEYKKMGDIPDIVLINYESLISKKNINNLTKMIEQNNFACVIDESQKLRNHKSLISKTVLELAPKFKYRIVMSGSPVPNCETELFTQISFISNCLPRSFYAFRNTYFNLERNGQIVRGETVNPRMLREYFAKGWKYFISETNRKKLINLIAPVCHWVEKKDVLSDLPEQIDEIRNVYLSVDELKHYKEMKHDFITEIAGKEIAVQVMLAKMQKLRQAASGFMYDENQLARETGYSKFKILLEVLEELGNQQVIIVCQYKHEIKKIEEHLKKKCATLYSETDDKDDSILKFKNNEVQYLVCHPLSGGKGLTLNNSSSMVFYSFDYSWEANYQMRERIHRIGTKNSCLYIYLVAAGTMDEEILKVVTKKQTLQEAIYKIVKP